MGLLYDTIIGGGTLNEPNGKPEPHFALLATVHWMRALRIICEHNGVNFSAGRDFYTDKNRRKMSSLAENSVMEQLFLSLHHLSALEQMKSITPHADAARLGILGWYYGISNAASAMIAAQDGTFQEDHGGTALKWDNALASRNLVMEPFQWRISSLVETQYKKELASYRGTSTFNLNIEPKNYSEAASAAFAYLSGSADWYAWKAREDLKRSADFKALKVDDFRTKAAKELRDKRLSNRVVCFLHQASRYRGKANYREALFLAYGRNIDTICEGFVADQVFVLKAFLSMAGAFASLKLGKELWADFVLDVEANRAFSSSAHNVWK
jgi:hypothetical protein